jgi:hypothetical protein
MDKKIIFAVLSGSLFMYLFSETEFNFWEALSCGLMAYFLLEFIDNLGNKIVIMDLAILLAIMTCLLMPIPFYHYYTKENHLSRLWAKYMPIPSETYYSYVLPAVLAMAIGLRIPFKKLRVNPNPTIYLENVKSYLKNKPNLGLILIAIGIFSGLLDFLSPANLKQVFYLSEHLTYVGVFYVLYSPATYKKMIVPGVVILMITQSLITGMFGEFVYMMACSMTLILLGSKVSFRLKLTYAVLGIFLVFLLQSVKMDYRKRNWVQGAGADPAYFAFLIADRVTNMDNLVNPDNMFFITVRMNQGWLVALTMKRVPARRPFAYGETIISSVEAAILPRFIWEDKPNAGGKANLLRFWGFTIYGVSMNIGPLGEAYGNFDVTGGIVFMFFYGLFFNFMFARILKFSEKRPTVVLWLPFLFFYSVQMETDLLTTMGALVKGLIFMWFVFQFFRIAVKIDL